MSSTDSPRRLHRLPRLGMDAQALSDSFWRYLGYTLGRDRWSRDEHYAHEALVLAIRDRLMERWKETHRRWYAEDARRAYYFSMEYLMGRALRNALVNLGIEGEVREMLEAAGLGLEELAEVERDAALGNGGLGRLAACFMDACATLELPVMGYGLRYEYGMFHQRLEDGRQVEEPDHWLASGNPWDIQRPEYTQLVRFGGHTETYRDDHGVVRHRWVGAEEVEAIPYDTPIPGYRNDAVNTLRLWKAAATEEFSLAEFNAGDYAAAVTEKNRAEYISMVLYPNDTNEAGKRLRLRQQYFLVSASLQDVLRRWRRVHGDDFSRFARKHCFQLNDTHPSLAVAELMRLLMDEHRLGWEEAWEITTRTTAYTNHTLMPEALERWPVAYFEEMLPRILEIVYEVNARFLAEVARRWPGDTERLRRLSLVEEGPERQVRMAHLAVVGSFSVNGVAQLHTELLTQGLFRDFAELWPEKLNNKTNGVTPRRWLLACNPLLAELVTETIGDGWVTDLPQLAKLEPFAEDPEIRSRWREIKAHNKRRLAGLVEHETGVRFAPDALFDIQVKRIHEYKRQLLNALHVIHLYDRVKRGDTEGLVPRAVLFGGKAAPGYRMAKIIIKLISNVARVVNRDPEASRWLQVAFVPDYRVSIMEVVAPAADLSEQISTAGKEASGTGNMKLMMNGALTIGTYDGANIEILEEVGEEHFFRFGLTAPEVTRLRPGHDPFAAVAADRDLDRVIDLLESGHFNQFEPGIFDDLLRSLLDWGDRWMVTADFASYRDAQERAARAYGHVEGWTRSSILNTASSGRFSVDRTVAEYNREIWRLEPVPVELSSIDDE